MKNHILLIVSILTVISIKSYGQNGFPYQAVLRDNTGTTINNQHIMSYSPFIKGTMKLPYTKRSTPQQQTLRVNSP